MCNRYRMTAKQAELAARYGVPASYLEDETFPPPELFPDNLAWTVRENDSGRVLDVMRWGFPHRVRGKSGKMLDRKITNVRNLDSPFWRSALVNPERRCVVPVTDFCEWEGEKGAKIARWFSVPSRPIFSFAGVWRPLEGGERAFAFLTCEPNSLVAPIHPKAMPVVLDDEGEARWLQEDWADARELVSPFPSQLMTVA